MIMALYESDSRAPAQLFACRWRVLILEFIYGVACMIWFAFMLAESILLKGMNELERLTVSQSDHRGASARLGPGLIDETGRRTWFPYC